MKIEVKGFEVYLGADNKSDSYTLHIPKLKIFKTFSDLKDNPISVLESHAKEILKKH